MIEIFVFLGHLEEVGGEESIKGIRNCKRVIKMINFTILSCVGRKCGYEGTGGL